MYAFKSAEVEFLRCMGVEEKNGAFVTTGFNGEKIEYLGTSQTEKLDGNAIELIYDSDYGIIILSIEGENNHSIRMLKKDIQYVLEESCDSSGRLSLTLSTRSWDDTRISFVKTEIYAVEQETLCLEIQINSTTSDRCGRILCNVNDIVGKDNSFNRQPEDYRKRNFNSDTYSNMLWTMINTIKDEEDKAFFRRLFPFVSEIIPVILLTEDKRLIVENNDEEVSNALLEQVNEMINSFPSYEKRIRQFRKSYIWFKYSKLKDTDNIFI